MKKILVVDDDEGILDAVSLILQDEGYAVETVTKGSETFKKISAVHPDVIILDVLMSGTDGRDICRKIKADHQMKGIPVIMMSAHPAANQGAVDCGADGFVAKPFEINELLDEIKRHT